MISEYYTPTRVVFGEGAAAQAGARIREQGGTKVLLHYGSGSAQRSGLLDLVRKSLTDAALPFVELGGALPNPRLSKVREGVELGRREGVDFLLAVGGGSAIDSAKAIAMGLPDGGDVWDFFAGKRRLTAASPVGCVLTLAATGSEMSDGTVITNEDGWYKKGFGSDLLRCRFALMDPALTATLPPYQTSCGAVDIMMHTLERFFSHTGHMELTESIAVAVLRCVMDNAPRALRDPGDLSARGELMWAGSLSHNGLTSFGADGGDWSCHKLEHELGGLYDVAHGAGLAALWGSWARYVMPADPHRFAVLAHRLFGVSPSGFDREDALAGIAAMEGFFRSISMPTSLHELLGRPISAGDIALMADKASAGGTRTVGAFRPLEKADMIAVYTAAR